MEKGSVALRRRTLWQCIAIAALSAMGLALYSPYGPLALQEALFRALGGFAAGFGMAWFSLPRVTARRLRYGLWIGALFGASCAVGAELQGYGTFRLQPLPLLTGLLCWLGLTVLFTVLTLFAIDKGGRLLTRLPRGKLEAWAARSPLLRPTHRRENPQSGHPRLWNGRFFLLVLGTLLVLWLPVWLANFPGLASHDIRAHMGQIMDGGYHSGHSTLYTFLIGFFMWVSGLLGNGGGNPTLFLALLCGFQMLLVASALAFALTKSRAYGTPLAVCVAVVAFFGLFPVIPILAISTTKDVPFAALCLYFGSFLLAFLREPWQLSSWRCWLRLVLTGFGLSLLRHNGVASMAILLVCILLLSRAKGRGETLRVQKRRLSLCLACALAVAGLGGMAVNQLLNVQPSFVTKRDMASVPCQQLVRAMKEMSPQDPLYQEAVQFFKLAEITDKYVPKLADPVKQLINVVDPATGQDTGWGGFLKAWVKVGLRHPKAYAEALLELNRGLWFVQDVSHAKVYPEHFNLGYLLSGQDDLADLVGPVQYTSVFPGLQSFLYRLTSQNAFLEVPVLRVVFSVGAHSWACVLLLVAAAYRRDRSLMVAMGWFVSLLALLLFSPTVLVRYYLPIILGNALGLPALLHHRPSLPLPPQGQQPDGV